MSEPTPTGARAQLLALARDNRALPIPGRSPDPSARRSAVLVLFGVLDTVPAATPATPNVAADLDVLLTRRSPDLTHHPGQIAFPGGGIDDDDGGPEDAAVREAVEETGLDPAGVEVLGRLGDLGLPVSDNVVTPVLAWWATPSPLVPDGTETAEVFRVPVADLVDPGNRRTTAITRGSETWRGPAFEVADRVVWGFTAMVLDALLDALGWSEPWDRRREIPVPL
ncbi:NUDIX hydrolase [Beutenbergia cavernae DSM 12333]|uniref:NUDIX hydrolase n=1 Tax=Beutenbergia cavernae (strain ATCC BAA-8 / DSM 12333 / CCUG 43141 / JCM 11478 / NBRC 16432 / NCIMB 13614 / HKI 0122) TaxID=471853 RepID=C5C5L3_BEUC1|nr:CoA pyrophosphatase [Beutenbergia cavernae]ACQ80204.1 NUDIX hydrolase [Beutenbergia cavernae DSM 12333]